MEIIKKGFESGIIGIIGITKNDLLLVKEKRLVFILNKRRMSNIKYIIRTRKECLNKEGKSIIFLRYTHKTKVTYISTGRTISPDFWNPRSQQIRQAYKGYTLFNQYLDKFRQRIEDFVHQALIDEKDPTTLYIKQKVKHKKDEKNKEFQQLGFFDFFKEFIEISKSTKSKGTITSYKNTIKHFLEYEKYKREALSFESFDMNFYDQFRYYIIQIKGMGNNSFGKQIKTLKTVLNNAIERGYKIKDLHKNKKFKVLSEEAESIYLTDEEIVALMECDLSHTPKLDRARDLFIVGCCTGLRFSDFSQIKPENIKPDFIQIRTQKTSQTVIIPLHPFIRLIIKKYEGRYSNNLPPAISNQKLNEYLKEAGKFVQCLHQDILITKTKGNDRIEKIYKKYELLTTHCARRSFSTNLFKQGFPALSIMKITGHKTEKAFMKYIRINEEETAVLLKEFWSSKYESQQILPTPILKIA